MMFKKKQRQIDKVIKEHYWDGFIDCVAGFRSGLEYASASRFARYNEARQIAYDAGWTLAEEALKRRGTVRINFINKDIPARVYADAYASVR